MRFLATLVVAAAMAAPSFAEAARCSEPRKPSTHLFSSWDEETVEKRGERVEEYEDKMRKYIRCLNKAASDAAYELEEVRDEWRESLDKYQDENG